MEPSDNVSHDQKAFPVRRQRDVPMTSIGGSIHVGRGQGPGLIAWPAYAKSRKRRNARGAEDAFALFCSGYRGSIIMSSQLNRVSPYRSPSGAQKPLFLQNHSFLPHELAWLCHASRYATSTLSTASSWSSSGLVSAPGLFPPCFPSHPSSDSGDCGAASASVELAEFSRAFRAA